MQAQPHDDVKVFKSYIKKQYAVDAEGHYKVSHSTNADGVPVENHKQIINARVKITAAYADDAGEPYPINVTETPDRIRPVVTHYDLNVSRKGDGEVDLPDVPAEDFDKVTWINRFELGPLPVLVNSGQSTRNDIVSSIKDSSPFEITLTFGRLGWHYRDGRWMYVHGGGAWTADGEAPARIHGDGLGLFTMAQPPKNDAEGTRAFYALWDLFEMGPDKFAAVEIGAAFRAAMGRPVGSITYRAQNQSGKSGRMAFLAQCWAPSVRWRRLPFNAGKQFATPAYIEHVHHTFGDMIVPWDDMAPVGTPRERADYFDMFARSLFNGSSKGRMGVKDNKIQARARLRPRAFGALSAEDLDGVESALNRTHILRLSRDVFNAEAFEMADKDGSPQDRSALMSAFIQWWAAKMPAYSYVNDLESKFQADLAEATDAPGRYVESVADKAAGIYCGLEFAKERGWVSPEHADQLWARAWAGLCESLTDQVDDLEGVSMSDRIRDAIYDGLATRSTYVLGVDGSIPPDHTVYGWTFDGIARGNMIGWTDQTRLYLVPSAAAAFVSEYTHSSGAPMNITARAMGEALEAANYITGSDERAGGRTIHRSTIAKKIQGKKRNVWSMDHPEEVALPEEQPVLQTSIPQPTTVREVPPPRSGPVATVTKTSTSVGVHTIKNRVREVLASVDGDPERATKILTDKYAVDDANAILQATRTSARYDFTAHPPEPDILRKPAKNRPNQVWEARPHWVNRAVPTGTEITALDVNAAYLSALNTHLPIGKLEHQDGDDFDKNRSGLYLITPGTWDHADLPNPIGNRELTGTLWVARPTVQLLMDAANKGLCDTPKIHESWTSGSSENLLRKFRDILRDARHEAITDTDDVTLTYVKAMYSKFISTATKTSRFNHHLERTDWAHIIRAQAHANLWRRALRAREGELTIYSAKGTDELHVVGDWRQVFSEGRALGQMKSKNVYRVGE